MASRREGGAVAGSRERPGSNAARRQLLDALFTAGRELSAAAVMFHTALAARQGLTATEEKALGPLFTDWVGELEDLSEKYTDAELRAITDFLTESARRQKNATARLTAADARTPADTDAARPAGHGNDGVQAPWRPAHSGHGMDQPPLRAGRRDPGSIHASVADDDG